jgi:hypothetical protein
MTSLAARAVLYATSFALATSAAAQPPAARPVAAEPRWVVDASGNSCAMHRDLAGTPNAAIVVRTYPGSGQYSLLLASREWPDRVSRDRNLTLRLAGGGEGSIGSLVPISGPRRHALTFFMGRDFLAHLGASATMTVLANARPLATYELPQHAEIARVFAQCESAALIEWGADPAAFQPGGRRAVPSSDPYQWLTSRELFTPVGAHLEAAIRLNVNAEGRVERCAVVEGNLTPPSQQAFCEALTERGRFEPARAPDGRAVGSVAMFHVNVRRNTITTTDGPGVFQP